MNHSGKQPARLTQSSVASGFQAVRTPYTDEGCLSRGGWEERWGDEGSLAGKPKLEPCDGLLETQQSVRTRGVIYLPEHTLPAQAREAVTPH